MDHPDQKFVDINRAEKGKIINVVRKIKTKEWTVMINLSSTN